MAGTPTAEKERERTGVHRVEQGRRGAPWLWPVIVLLTLLLIAGVAWWVADGDEDADVDVGAPAGDTAATTRDAATTARLVRSATSPCSRATTRPPSTDGSWRSTRRRSWTW